MGEPRVGGGTQVTSRDVVAVMEREVVEVVEGG
jgi:hypothetical protein